MCIYTYTYIYSGGRAPSKSEGKRNLFGRGGWAVRGDEETRGKYNGTGYLIVSTLYLRSARDYTAASLLLTVASFIRNPRCFVPIIAPPANPPPSSLVVQATSSRLVSSRIAKKSISFCFSRESHKSPIPRAVVRFSMYALVRDFLSPSSCFLLRSDTQVG